MLPGRAPERPSGSFLLNSETGARVSQGLVSPSQRPKSEVAPAERAPNPDRGLSLPWGETNATVLLSLGRKVQQS
jgi:hypothetical protein